MSVTKPVSRVDKEGRARAWSGLLCLAAGGVMFAQAQVASAQAQATQVQMSARIIGSTKIQGGPSGPDVVSAFEITDDIDGGVKAQGVAPAPQLAAQLSARYHRLSNLPIPSKQSGRGTAAAGAQAPSGGSTLPPPPTAAPNPAGRMVIDASSTTFSFDALSHRDQRLAGTGDYVNTQFSLEPPDQALCAGNGFVLEGVNNAIELYDASGNSLSGGAEALSQFWGLAPEIIRSTGVRGPFISDPKCAYDRASGRWFVSELASWAGRYYNLIAVSHTADPRDGFVSLEYDVSDDGQNGTPSHPGCPCLGDQPLLGFDHYGVYQSTNEFGNNTFNGAQIYALSKAELIAAADGSSAPVTLVAINAGGLPAPSGGTWYSVQPAVSAVDNTSGTEYFLSALQFGVPPYQQLDNRIAVWALGNTASLASGTPALTLSWQVMASQTYGQPNPVQQRPGPLYLGGLVGDPLEYLNPNDDRMNQVVYANGKLYGAVNTIIGDGTRNGIAWFSVVPSVARGQVSGHVAAQGYVAVNGNSVLFPSIAMTEGGSGAMTFSLAGPDYFPSAAYVAIPGNGNAVQIAANGAGPDDGFTGYQAEVGGPSPGVARWGDYSAAVVDGADVWMASEYIPNRPRTLLANWGTRVTKVTPGK